MSNEWLAKLKKGDKVIIANTRFGIGDRVSVVDHATKTQLVVSGCSNRFRRESGDEIRNRSKADRWNGRLFLKQWTMASEVKVKEEHERNALVHRMGNIKWVAYSLPTLRRIASMLDEENP